MKQNIQELLTGLFLHINNNNKTTQGKKKEEVLHNKKVHTIIK